MFREIKYRGCSENPSDYDCVDGDLSMSLGAVPEDGALRPVLPPVEIMQLGNGCSVRYIHQSSDFKHYIVVNKSNKVSWTAGTGPIPITADTPADTLPVPIMVDLGTYETIYQITSIGNTLLVLAGDGMHYYLWQDSKYKYLGSKIPECPLTFGLQGEMIQSDEFSITFDEIKGEDLWKEFTEDNKNRITEQVLAQVNKFIAEHSTNSGKFIYPFFVRYAYRLYDGSLTMHSSPVLMYASTDIAPQVFWTDFDYKKRKDLYTGAKLRIVSMLHSLDYGVPLASVLNIDSLKEWKDIVRSVDLFITPPIYTYDQNGKCTKFTDADEQYHKQSYCICKHINQSPDIPQEVYPLRYQKHSLDKLYAFTFSPEDLNYTTKHLLIPRRSIDDVKDDIRSSSQFYLLESINLEELSTARQTVKVPDDYLQSLVVREVMTDDYDSHEKLIPRYAFSYNSRLNITDLSKKLYTDYSSEALLPFTNGYVLNYAGQVPTIHDETIDVDVYFYIKQDGRSVIVKGWTGKASYFPQFSYIYYPNPNAYKVLFVAHRDASIPSCYEAPLEQHRFLNGAFYFKGWGDPSVSGRIPDVSTDAACTFKVLNKIYTSEINNPFYFPLLGINTVGTGHIMGVSSAVRALSEGQFGQFPLYAFTSEGVWALEISSTGSYSSVHPVARDVCINAESITQIDGAVLFATARGIMMLSGSQTTCITDVLDTRRMFDINDLPNSQQLIQFYNSMTGERYHLEDIRMLPLKKYLKGCRMIYDYTNRRIIVYNPSVCYAYVFSIDSQQWGMMFSNLLNNVNSYPEALAMNGDFRLVDFSHSSAKDVNAFIVTRPFKTDAPDILKTVDTVIQRGDFVKNHVAQALYGTRDYMNWHLIKTSGDRYLRGFSGTPYKAFRLVLFCQLDAHESIQQFSMQYKPKHTDKLR